MACSTPIPRTMYAQVIDVLAVLRPTASDGSVGDNNSLKKGTAPPLNRRSRARESVDAGSLEITGWLRNRSSRDRNKNVQEPRGVDIQGLWSRASNAMAVAPDPSWSPSRALRALSSLLQCRPNPASPTRDSGAPRPDLSDA